MITPRPPAPDRAEGCQNKTTTILTINKQNISIMKKLFFYLSAVMLAVAAVSCQKEMVVADGEDGNVTLTIQTPEVATKAIADGMNVDIVHYEIYKNENGHKNSLSGTRLIKGSVPMSAKGATLSLNLLQGQEYVGLFWAQVNGQSYYDVTDLRDVKVAYPNEENNLTYANDEARAAFCQIKTFSAGKNVTVVLERPFAQINLGTTIADLTEDYTITLEELSMTVTGVANTFNVAAMTAGTTANNVVFSLATVPYAFNPSETLTANNQTWAYAGMNYVLVPNDAATVDVTYSIKTDVGTVSRQVPTVPVQKNHRTNLLGNLLTQETAIEIVVDERFAEPDLAPEAIYMAAAMGGEFTLTEDVVLTEPLVIQSSLVLNLDGYSLNGGKVDTPEMTGTDISAITIENGATLTIEGEGNIVGTEYGVYVKKGNVVVKGGNITAGTSAVQVYNGTAAIKGGNFAATKSSNYVVNCIDANWKNGTAKVSITGGSFVGFNPESNAAEGVGTNFVADGYKAVQDGNDWFVTEETAVIVTPETLSSTDFNQSATFMMVGDFSSVPAIGITPTEGVNATVDASRATFGNRFKFNIPAVPDNANVVSRDNDRKGNYTLTNFNGTTLNLGAYGTSVVITNSTLDCIDVYAANISLDINGNTINSGYLMHPRTSGGETDYAAYLMMMAYDLKFDNNNVTKAIGHAVAINGAKATFGTPVNSANEVKSFTGNTITGISGSTKNNRAGFKIWDDLTYAHSGEKTFAELPAAGQQLITTIENDHTNVFEKAEGTSNTAYMINFYEYYHNELL